LWKVRRRRASAAVPTELVELSEQVEESGPADAVGQVMKRNRLKELPCRSNPLDRLSCATRSGKP